MAPSPFVLLQHVLPKRLLTELAGRCARAHAGPLTTAVIRWFVRRYGVALHEAAEPDPARYPTFNAFFTRALRDGARPLADAPLVCPVDGAVGACGTIDAGRLLQAKGHWYTATALLGGDAALAERFREGRFATLYLSPRDYHRIHMPCAGRLVRMVHVPGSLYSVNPITVDGIPDLFARNERVICLFEGAEGPFVLVLVGATIVGSIATTWHGPVTPPRPGTVRAWDYAPADAPTFAQGDEMGRFLLGSTVVVLLPPSGAPFPDDWTRGRPVQLGEAMTAGPALRGANP